MTRGRPPRKGIVDATTVATTRGTVICFMRSSDNLCDFMIKSNDKIVFVSVRKAIRLSENLEKMEREFQEPIYLAPVLSRFGKYYPGALDVFPPGDMEVLPN